MLMAQLYDPLKHLRSLGAVPHLVKRADGVLDVHLSWIWNSRRVSQAKGLAVLARYKSLLILQLDVETGTPPRSVQKLVACGMVCVANGRYKLVG